MAAEGNPRTLFRSPRLAASLRAPWLADDTCELERSSTSFVFEHMRVLPEPERSSPVADTEALSSHQQRDFQVDGALGEELALEKPFIARLQKTGLEMLEMNWDKLESEPLSLLHEYAKNAGVPLMFLERNSQGPSLHFTMYAVVDKKTFPDGSGTSKREAKNQAAYLALCKLRKLLESQAAKELELVPKSMRQNEQVREPPPIEHVIPHEDRCAAMCSEAFDRLLEKLPEYRSCKSSIAAFIMGKVNQESKDSNDDVYELVALGTGEVSYPGCVVFNGMLLHDAHALVVARRALQR